MADISKIFRSRLDSYKQQLEAGNYEKASDIFTDDAQLFAPNKKAYVGRKGLIAFIEDLKTQGSPGIEFQRVADVELTSPDWAIATLYYNQTVGGKSTGPERALMVWKKVGEQWYVYRSAFNDEPK